MEPTDSHAYELALTALMDSQASAHACGSIEIDAPRDAVWDAVADVEQWPRIRSDISHAVASAPPAPGTSFTWSANGLPLSSAFALVERSTRLTWATIAPGFAMTCVYEFDDLAPSRTRIRCEESMNAATVAPEIDDIVLAESIRTWLVGIKGFVENKP